MSASTADVPYGVKQRRVAASRSHGRRNMPLERELVHDRVVRFHDKVLTTAPSLDAEQRDSLRASLERALAANADSTDAV